jgi:hypothetical protein
MRRAPLARLCLLIALAPALLVSAAGAQNYATVTATNIIDPTAGGTTKLPDGTICFQATNGSDIPIPFKAGGGGQVVTLPACASITAGVVGTLQIANPALTNPAHIVFRITVLEGSAEVARYTNVDVESQIVGGVFNFDTCNCSASTITPATTVYDTMLDESIALTQRRKLNFTGTGVVCADNPSTLVTECTIAGPTSLGFNQLTGGTNSSAAMVVGTGASLGTSGSGTIAATTAAAFPGNPGNCAAGNSAAGVDASGVAEGCAARAQTLANAANQWLNSYDASTGLFTQTQPASSNLSDAANVALYTNGDKTWGGGSAFTWTFDGGANTDPTFIFTSGTNPSIATNSSLLVPAGTAANVAIGLSTNVNYGIRFATAQTGVVMVSNGSDIGSFSQVNGFYVVTVGMGLGTAISGGSDVKWTRCNAACLRWGAADVNGAPVAQTMQVQNAITGTDLAAATQWRFIGPKGTGAGGGGKIIFAVGDTQTTGTTAHATRDLEEWIPGTVAVPEGDEVCLMGTHGELWCRGVLTELLTLSTVGLTTDTTNNLLPAGAIIESVEARVTTTITTTTNWAVGDTTTAARFCAANATLTAGTTSTCLQAWQGSVATDAAGPVQAAAGKVRITCTGANPGAGVIRITVFYRRFVAPTS